MNIHISVYSSTCTRFICVQYTLPRRVCNQFDEKTTEWKIKLQVASILIRFMRCHSNWKYILHESDEIIGPGLCFKVSLRLMVTAMNDPSEALIKTPNHLCKPDCDGDLHCSSDCPVNRRKSSGPQSFTALLPVQLSRKAELRKKKKFHILHLILHLIVSLHNYDMRGKPVCLYCD